MKKWLLLMVLGLLLPSLPARAGAGGRTWDVLVVDKDPKGTNVRDAPSGRVITVIPFDAGDGPRLVRVTGRSGPWFHVATDGTEGWMHGSVLGLCAVATEDGDPGLSIDTTGTPSGIRIPAGAPLGLLGMHKEWLRVRYLDAKGNAHDGWLPEQAVVMSENGREACAKAWARK